MTDGWILCTESLPEELKDVLIYARDFRNEYHIEIAHRMFDGLGWEFYAGSYSYRPANCVYAWHELPAVPVMPGEEAADNGEMERDHSRGAAHAPGDSES